MSSEERVVSSVACSDRDIVLWIVYVLFLLGLLTGGLSILVGVVVSYAFAGDRADPLLYSHSRWQRTTFWRSLIGVLIVGALPWTLMVWRILRLTRGGATSNTDSALTRGFEGAMATAMTSSLLAALIGGISLLLTVGTTCWFWYRTGRGLFHLARDQTIG